MGEVYRARDTKLNRDVAIKVVLPSVVADPRHITRFAREAQLLAALNDPNRAHLVKRSPANGETEAPSLVIVENWQEELRRRVPVHCSVVERLIRFGTRILELDLFPAKFT